MKLPGQILVLSIFLASPLPPLQGALTLPSIFSDHAVLQKADGVPIWGKADPGDKISVTLGKINATATTKPDGRWMATLDLEGADTVPQDLVVEGKSRIVVRDVIVGQVWLCSGQSNMAFTLNRAAGGKEEIASSANPQLRQFLVKHQASPTPLDECEGYWTLAGPATSAQFSAVGYFFGKKLQKELGQPVGLINSSWGGTPIEAWLSPEAIASNPGLETGKEKILAALSSFAARQQAFVTQAQDWIAHNNRTDHPGDPQLSAGISVDESGWTSIEMPAWFSAGHLPANGVVWLRKKVTVPAEAAGKELELRLGIIHDFDAVYWNGVHVDGVNPDQPGSGDERRYNVPADLIKTGEAILAIRIYSPWGKGGIDAFNAPFTAGAVSLKGPWLARVEYELPPLAPDIAATHPIPPKKPLGKSNLPNYLFNGMIHPLIPYALRGILWYQGEQNISRAFQYREELPLLIQGWRKSWGVELPFLFCQLPNCGSKKSNGAEESNWAELRESQAQALALPGTGMAVLIDTGNGNVHPTNKKDPGQRAAAVALAMLYGKDVPFSGPVYRSMSAENGKIRLHFDHTDGGLIAGRISDQKTESAGESAAPPADLALQLQGFAICDSNRKWKPALARIEGDSVLVWSPEVSDPQGVRYAWASNPVCNFYNAAGLPAAPFRTDDYPLGTQGRNY